MARAECRADGRLACEPRLRTAHEPPHVARLWRRHGAVPRLSRRPSRQQGDARHAAKAQAGRCARVPDRAPRAGAGPAGRAARRGGDTVVLPLSRARESRRRRGRSRGALAEASAHAAAAAERNRRGAHHRGSRRNQGAVDRGAQCRAYHASLWDGLADFRSVELETRRRAVGRNAHRRRQGQEGARRSGARRGARGGRCLCRSFARSRRRAGRRSSCRGGEIR